MPRRGSSAMMRERLSRSSTAIRVSSNATQEAKRSSPSIMDISPSVLPGPARLRRRGRPLESFLTISHWPSITFTMKSPRSPSRIRVAPAGAR